MGATDEDDAALAARVSNDGDPEAFGELFDRHAQVVYRFCWRRLAEPRSGVDAEDLLSVVFLEAWAGRARLVLVDGSLRPWLLGIAANVVRNQRRSARRHRAALARLAPERDTPDHAARVAQRLDDDASAADLLHALDALSARERDVVDLCLVHGVATEQAARVLGIPEGTVKSRLARARRRLATLLRTGDTGDPALPYGHGRGGRAGRAPVPRSVG